LEKAQTDQMDAEKLLSLFKLGAEAEKLEAEKNKATQDAAKVAIDATLAAKQLGLSYLSTLTSQLVPLAALLTVAVTFYGSYQQNKQTREAEITKLAYEEQTRQRLEWEAYKNSFDNLSADDQYKKPTFVSRLKIFIASGKYASEISDIRTPLLGDFTNKSGFLEVWSNTFKELNEDNFQQVIDVARAQKNKYNRALLECGLIPIPPNSAIPIQKPWAALGPCVNSYPSELVAQAYNDKPELSKRVSVLRDQAFGQTYIMGFLSEKIGAYVKATSTAKNPKPYDLSEINLGGVNLDGVNFSKMNLSQTKFYQSSIKGAVLSLPTNKSSYDFQGTAWWEVASIDQTVLRFLIANSYPGSAQHLYAAPAFEAITEDRYKALVQGLCENKSGWCDKSCIKYDSSKEVPPICSAN
jgi:hypothetical protein